MTPTSEGKMTDEAEKLVAILADDQVGRYPEIRRAKAQAIALAIVEELGITAEMVEHLREMATNEPKSLGDERYGDLPIKEMIERGWIKGERVDKELRQFFGAANLSDVLTRPVVKDPEHAHAAADALSTLLAVAHTEGGAQ